MDQRHSLRLGRIAGIAVDVHYTWLFIGAMVAWSLAQGAFPASHPGWSAVAYWAAAIIASLALFVSVLVHELAHSVVAGRLGARVESITLFVFGGVSLIRDEPQRPRDEFLIAVVGPLASFALAGLFWALRGVVPLGDPSSVRSIAHAVLDYLTTLNVLLGVFNLLPGFPLDGGRVLRSILWGMLHSFKRATSIASYVGQAVGYLLVFAGLGQVLGGNVLSGLWAAFIGWYLNGAAESTRRSQTLEHTLHGVRVAAMMDSAPPVVLPSTSVQEFLFSHALAHGRRCLLLVEEGKLRGLVTIADVKHVPQQEWATTPLSQITAGPLHTVTPESGIGDALRIMVQESLHQLPVVEGDRLVGLLTRSDVLRSLQWRRELHVGDDWPRAQAQIDRQAPTQAAA